MVVVGYFSELNLGLARLAEGSHQKRRTSLYEPVINNNTGKSSV